MPTPIAAWILILLGTTMGDSVLANELK